MKKISLLILLCFFISGASARHIIGGEITYVCNGDGDYTFTMFVYRDCLSGGADFDDPAVITIYREVNGSYSEFVTFEAPLRTIESIPLPEDPCTTLPAVCAQKGTYRFARNLPTTNQQVTYHVVYQRCCRNNTIANLNDPGSQGVTYTLSLSPEVLRLNDAECNSTPTFNNFPPIVICAGFPVEFDHSATDINTTDQLVYRFCSPEQGGGLAGSPGFGGLPTDCNGVAPSPACPPPFPGVNFTFPTYSPTNPMGGDPQVRIDPTTGLITGIPNVLGQFVVGVCVEEYRNGSLLSTVSRDFQFNVTNCEPTVAAVITSDEVRAGNEYIVISCGENDVFFDNQSVQRENIEEFFWTFDTNGDGVTENFTEWSPTISFPDTGFYQGSLVLNPGLNCADTALISLNIYPAIYANYTYAYDTCIAGPVTFTDASFSDAGPNTIVDWFWEFGDGNTSSEENPVHTYSIPGNFPVSLTVTDINGCMITEIIPLPYFPAPAVIIIEPSTFIGCEPAKIFFNNLSVPIDSTYDIIWDFGDGNTSSEISPTHLYEEPGIYDISIQITSPIGCFAESNFNDYITILISPDAGFSFTPESLNTFERTATFTDESLNADRWFYQFGESGVSFEQNPVYVFPDTGIQVITQVVTHPSGCTDTAVQTLDVIPQVRYFLPNAFTPNFDDLNDEFLGVGIFEGMRDFEMQIWNRWGELMFDTNDPFEGWNGQKQNSGRISPNGVYVYRAYYVNPRGRPIELKGYATLVK